jgi:hypothetical protein
MSLDDITLAVDYFDLKKIAESGQCFRWKEIGPGKYLIPSGQTCAIMEQKEPDDDLHLLIEEGTLPLWQDYLNYGERYGSIVREAREATLADGSPDLFIPNEGTAYLLDLLSRMTDENSVSTKDNGVTQTVEARQGVALNALVEVKPRIQLQPFRTFLEVPQPESEFLLRVDPNEGIGFFEADGGVWKLEAKRNIADYFEKNLKDLIEAGKVVVMK